MLIHTVYCASHLLLLQMSNELIALVFIVHIQPPKRIWMLLLKLCTLIVGFRTKLVYYIVPQGKCWWNMIPSSHSFGFEPPQDRPWFYNFTPWRTESMIIHYKMIHDPQKTIEIENSKPIYDSLKNPHADSVGRRFSPRFRRCGARFWGATGSGDPQLAEGTDSLGIWKKVVTVVIFVYQMVLNNIEYRWVLPSNWILKEIKYDHLEVAALEKVHVKLRYPSNL